MGLMMGDSCCSTSLLPAEGWTPCLCWAVAAEERAVLGNISMSLTSSGTNPCAIAT